MDKKIVVFKPIDVQLTIKMSGHDWASFHDIISEADKNSDNIEQEKLVDIFMELDDNIKGDVFSFGINDTEVSEKIYEWLLDNKGKKW